MAKKPEGRRLTREVIVRKLVDGLKPLDYVSMLFTRVVQLLLAELMSDLALTFTWSRTRIGLTMCLPRLRKRWEKSVLLS